MSNEMVVQTVAPDENPAQPNHNHDSPDHALTGKIARLPKDIRDQLNRRLENGEPATNILPWLNDLPIVKTILARQFGGVPVSDANLTNWRQGGYQRWLNKREPLACLKELREDAADISSTGKNSFAGAAAAVASGQILQLLLTTPRGSLSIGDLTKYAFSITAILDAEQNSVRLQHEKTRICQRDHELLLQRNRDQRKVADIGLRLVGDVRAKEIEAAPISYHEKIELLGRHLFNDLWQARPVPEANSPPPQDQSNLG